ncbi:MAG: recombination protein O N-terminal domain-containing protein [Bacteroidales bacterium]|nr:recombination protein O N-terminal domain-containing protein [Bacteroidales bacterium]
MILSSRLIVLNSTKVGDNSLVLHCISRELGRRSFIAGVRKGGSKAMYLPLSILDTEIVENSKSDLWRLRGISAAFPLTGLRSSFDKNAVTMFISEVLYRCLQSADAELYGWCERSILTLDSLEGDFSNYHLRFLLELCSVLGFSPSFESLAPFAEGNLAEMQDLLKADFASFLIYPLSGEKRSAMAEGLLRYISVYSEIPLSIRSLAVLSELYR